MTQFTAALLVWIRLLALGLAWLWVFPVRPAASGSERISRWLYQGAAAITLGVVSTGLATLLLGEWGVFTPWADRGVRLALAGTGVGLALWRCPLDWGRRVRDALPVSAAVLAGIWAILLLPQRGEWMVGGWDPGVYMNEAAALSRTGTFYPPDSFFYETLDEDEREAFTRSGHGRTERFPAVLVNPEKQSFTFEFFRLTPALYAAVQRSGGLHAMLRANTILALLVLPVFLALIRPLGLPHAVFSTLLLAIQPIWLFHTHFPVTEMFHLFLLTGLLWLVVDRPPDPRTTALAALTLFAAVLNRFSFLPFAALLLCWLALADACRSTAAPAWRRRLALIGAALAGLATNLCIAPASPRGWSDTTLILRFAAVATAAALVLDLPPVRRRLRALTAALSEMHLNLGGALMLAGMASTWLLRGHIGRASDADNLLRLIPFIRPGLLSLAATGLLVLLFARPRLKSATIFPLFFFLLSVGWLLILRKSVVDWLPWATRRALPYLVPFVALAAGFVPARLWTLSWARRWGRGAAVLLLAALLGGTASMSRRAWRYTSYNSVTTILQKISAQIGDRDIVIVDHPLWGTPLALWQGKRVLNGREAWMDETGKRMRVILPALERLSREGWQIRFLTSTEADATIYPLLEPDRLNLSWRAPEFATEVVIQHPRADRYRLRTTEPRFSLYDYEPPATDSQPRTAPR